MTRLGGVCWRSLGVWGQLWLDGIYRVVLFVTGEVKIRWKMEFIIIYSDSAMF
jgi:hypothetical protein